MTPPSKALFSPVTAIFLIVLVDVLGYTLILPLLPFYAEHFGASPLTIGFLTASYAVCQLVSGPLLGRASDHMGRKPLLIVSQLGTFLGFLILAAAPNLTWLFVGRILDGMTAGNISLAQAAIADVTAPSERGKAFGKVAMAFGIGFLIGPAVSGWLAHIHPTLPILAGAALSALSIFATIKLLPKVEAAPAKEKKAQAFMIFDRQAFVACFRRPLLASRLIQFFFFIFSFALWTSGFALFAERQLQFHEHPFGVREVGFVLAYSGLMGILLQGFGMSRLLKRWSEQTLAKSGLAMMALGYLIMTQATQLSWTLVAVTSSGLGHSLTRPTLTSLISQSAEREEQGFVLGVNQSLQALAQTLAPLAGGLLIQMGWTSVWALAAALFASLSLGLIVRRELQA